jgi:hypothetical protein
LKYAPRWEKRMSEDHLAVKINGILYVKLEDAQKLRDALDKTEAENARLRKLVSYLAGTNTDHVQVALAGNPIICDAIYVEACALMGEKE